MDCDVHPSFGNRGLRNRRRYLSEAWNVRFGGGQGSRGAFGRSGPGWRTASRTTVRIRGPVALFAPISSAPWSRCLQAILVRSAAELLDRYGIDRAILITQSIIGIGAMPSAEAASAIATATNDWMEGPLAFVRSPLAGDDHDCTPGIRRVQSVKLSVAATILNLSRSFSRLTVINLLGSRFYHPIYATAERHRLPVALHVTGTKGTAPLGPSLAGGHPMHHFEWRMNYGHPYQAYLASLIGNGVFDLFPGLRIVFTEVGFAWLPDLMWRMDAFWKSAREDTPWLKKASE